MKKHNHESQNPEEALHDIVRNKFTPGAIIITTTPEISKEITKSIKESEKSIITAVNGKRNEVNKNVFSIK